MGEMESQCLQAIESLEISGNLSSENTIVYMDIFFIFATISRGCLMD
jgi:hypothetical protein